MTKPVNLVKEIKYMHHRAKELVSICKNNIFSNKTQT